jgi:DNA-binding transcriptional ArsR family regulator
MAGKKVKGEVESLRVEIQNLSEAVWALREHVTVQSAAVAAAAGNGRLPGVAAASIAADLAAGSGRGTVVTRGAVRNQPGTLEYRWDVEAGVESLLAIDDAAAAQFLAAVGHRQRLAILKAILEAPSTAADLVSRLDLGTTGAAYHHLNVLQAAGLVTQETRGRFELEPTKVSALLAIFAGIASAPATEVVETEPTADRVESAAEEGGDGKRKKRKSGSGGDD